jgi:hypothetical protein
MSITVQTVSAVATATSATHLTVTKPTGVAVGDLLIATLMSYAADSAGGDNTFNELSGWTRSINSAPASGDLSFTLQWKIADSGDVSASDYTFVASATNDNLRGQIIRASGHNSLNPLQHTDTYTGNAVNSATLSASTSYTPLVNGALIITMLGCEFTTGSTVRSFSAHTASGTSLTEGIDVGGSDGSGGASIASAYGVQSTAAEITTYGATINTSTPNHFGAIAVFLPPVNATGSNTLVTATTSTFTQSGTCDGIGGTNTLVTAAAAVNTQDGTDMSITQWSNPDKSNAPDWQNPDK